jgi:hypothetical protein
MCVATGTYVNAMGLPLVERWNGRRWSMEPLVSPPGAASLMLAGVSCAPPGVCAAVGTYYTAEGAPRVLLERLNGMRLSLERAPTLAGATNLDVTAVSCATAGACTAVGSAYIPARKKSVPQAIGWNGRGWALQAGADPVGATAASLRAVSCGGPAACTAIGYFSDKHARQATLVERWNGQRWSRERISQAVDAAMGGATAISCGAPAGCTVIGRSSGPGVAAHWNGRTWSIQTVATLPPSSSAQLSGLSCATATSCTAVGDILNVSSYHGSLAVHWNGRAWSVQRTPNHAGVANADPTSVSCASAGACTAVGTYVDPLGRQVLLAERWNGRSWSAQPIAGPANAQLTGVSCASATACTAVGIAPYGMGQGTLLAEIWKGRAWSMQSVPSPAGARSVNLFAVSCSSPTACTAVGSYDEPPRDGLTLAERWDGSHWSIQPTPSLPTAGKLAAISCVSTTTCTAVGSYYGTRGPLTLAERWDGTSWSIQPTVNTDTGDSHLDGVSCPTATSCVATGSAGEGLMLAERWDGSSWSMLPIPSLGTYSFLSSVSCATQTACVAVGFSDRTAAFVESWDGTNWSLQPVLGSIHQEGLNAVSCPTTSDCVVAVHSA